MIALCERPCDIFKGILLRRPLKLLKPALSSQSGGRRDEKLYSSLRKYNGTHISPLCNNPDRKKGVSLDRKQSIAHGLVSRDR
jgi:hypothetical protein